MCPQVDTSKEAILALPDRLRRMHPATLWKMQQRGMEIFRQHLSTLPAMLDTTFATLMARYRQSPEAAAATVAVAASSLAVTGLPPSLSFPWLPPPLTVAWLPSLTHNAVPWRSSPVVTVLS